MSIAIDSMISRVAAEFVSEHAVEIRRRFVLEGGTYEQIIGQILGRQGIARRSKNVGPFMDEAIKLIEQPVPPIDRTQLDLLAKRS
jgi:hypothetical protein